MENASNALLIGGGILIAMLILSIGVYLFANYNDLGTSYERTMETTEIQKFNEKFLKFEEREDITIQEIVSLANFAEEYNKNNGANITVKIESSLNLADSNVELIDKIKEDENQKYKVSNIEYDSQNKLINSISFRPI